LIAWSLEKLRSLCAANKFQKWLHLFPAQLIDPE